ncbi:MAG: GGDEF domain-containing protein [Clostridia bacterium]|nr:GGDEF domain-containing protein [Clostridia bacterium]
MAAAYYIEINALCIMILGILYFHVRKGIAGISRKADIRARLYRLLLAGVMVTCASDMIAGACQGMMFPGARAVLWGSNILYFVSTIVLVFLWTLYSMYVLKGKLMWQPMLISGLMCLGGILFFATTPLHHLGFTVDDANAYHRGPLVWIHWAIVFPGMIIPSVIAFFSKTDGPEKKAVSLFVIWPLITSFLQTISFRLSICQTGVTCGLFLLYIMLQSKAVTDAEMKAQLLGVLSNTDFMTGMKNRRAYETRLEELKHADWAAALFIDLNGLKRVNDDRGHKAGDDLICGFAELLKKYMDEEDVFRISGDEFVAVFTDEKTYITTGEKLIAQIGTAAACGRAAGSGSDILELVKQAEADMYKNKSKYYVESGLNRRR